MRKCMGFLFAMFMAVFGTPLYAMELSLDVAVEKILAESQDMKKAEANIKKADFLPH